MGSADLLTKLGSAARLQKRSVETYENLLSSIADLKIAKKTSEILSQMTSAKNMSALLNKTIGHSSMDMVIEAARSGDPKRPIEEFTNLLRNLSNRLSKLLTISEANKATPTDVQEVISLGIETYLYGQSIAKFNKLSRAQFAKD